MNADQIHAEDLARLYTAVNAGRWYSIRMEAAFYAHERIAHEEGGFQLWGIDFVTGKREPVQGETAYSWLEVHEVGIHFNSDHDGNFYYVARPGAWSAVRPNPVEVVELLKYAQDDAQDSITRVPDFPASHTPYYHMSYSTMLGAALLFEVRPQASLYPFV